MSLNLLFNVIIIFVWFQYWNYRVTKQHWETEKLMNILTIVSGHYLLDGIIRQIKFGSKCDSPKSSVLLIVSLGSRLMQQRHNVWKLSFEVL